MRVPTKTIYESMTYQVNKNLNRLTEATKVASTGKQINSLSDDPAGLAQVLNIDSALGSLDQLQRNLSTGQTWLSTGETTLSSVEDIINQAQTLSLQMANATYNASDRASAAEQVTQWLLELQDLANTQLNGSYIFSGTRTDTAPVEFDDPQYPTSVSYSGSATGFTIKTGTDSTMEVGFSAGELFWENGYTGDDSDTGIFNTLIGLRDSLEANDEEGIENAIENLDDDLDHIISKVSKIGTKVNTLSMKENAASDLELILMENKSAIEDADLVQAIADLESKQLAYEAALSASSKIMELSILDYI